MENGRDVSRRLVLKMRVAFVVVVLSTSWSFGLLYNIHVPSHPAPPDYHSYCQSDYFRVKCDQDEVILITHAKYGRMRISRCVKENFGYIGCLVDVLGIMDTHCSGKKACSIRILDDNFENYKPCHDDLKSYLEVTYACVKVIAPERHLCQTLKPITVRNQTGYLASVTSAETGCGTADSPWMIELLPGQRINITLFDFAIQSSNSSAAAQGTPPSSAEELAAWIGDGSAVHLHGDTVSKMCRVYAIIREARMARGVTVCGGEARSRTVYVTLNNTAEIRLIAGKAAVNSVNFMLRYEAVGCPDLQAPHGGWIKRGDSVVVLGCSDNQETWQLRCHGVTWIGEKRNCSKAERIVNGSGELGSSLSLPLGVSLVIIVTLALAVGLMILAVGIFCLKRIRSDGRSDVGLRTMRASTTCFTLNAGARSAAGASAASAETKTMMAPCDDPDATLGRAAPSHRMRGGSTGRGGPKPNAYACMKLLRGSPDHEFRGGSCGGAEALAVAAAAAAGDSLVFFDQFYSTGSDEIYASRSLARNNENRSLPEDQRHSLTAHAHDLVKPGCCRYALGREGQEFAGVVAAGNQMLHGGTSLQRQTHEHEVALLCRDEAQPPYACAKHHVTLVPADRGANEKCHECEQSRSKAMKDETNLF